jgi:hypothetical protein
MKFNLEWIFNWEDVRCVLKGDPHRVGDNFQIFVGLSIEKSKNRPIPPTKQTQNSLRWRRCRLPMVVHAVVLEPFHPLMAAIVERGVLAGHRFHVPEALNEKADQRFEASKKACPEGFQPWSSIPDDAVWLLVEKDMAAHESGTTVRFHLDSPPKRSVGPGWDIAVHDLLPPPRDGTTWRMFEDWAKGGTAASKGGYWCSLHDVASAICRVLPFLRATEGVFNISGRRYWTGKETRLEFMPLVERAKAGKTGAFGLNHLTASHTIPIDAVEVHHEAAAPARPELGAFHRFLEQHTGEGWRPIMPLRQSLMLLLAALENEG